MGRQKNGGMMSESSQLTFIAKSSTSCVCVCAAAEPMIASIHLPMVRYVVPGGGAHAEEEAAAAASVAGGLLILAKNEGDCINSKLRHQRGKAPASESERSVRLSNLQTDGGQAQMKSWPQISFRRRLLSLFAGGGPLAAKGTTAACFPGPISLVYLFFFRS